MTKPKIYVAGKIGGLSEQQYTELFKRGAAEAEALGYEAITPLDFPHDHDKSWQSYMKEDVTEMLKCDAVYALNNWRHSPGATIEIDIALKLGLNIIHQK